MNRLLICALIWLLQGCSAIKLGYQQLPTLSYWWLDSAVSFNNEQSVRAKDAIEQLHQWHRREELSAYADFLQRSSQWSAGPVEAGQICGAWSEVQTRLDKLMREAIRQAAPVAMALGPRQWSHLAKRWETQNEEWEKDWLRGDAQVRMNRRLERVLERYSSFYGDLNGEQIALVKNQLTQSAWTAEWGRRDRQRRQEDLLATLQRIAQGQLTSAQTEAALWAVWQRWLKPPDAAGAALMQTMSQQACNNLTQLHNTTTPEQRLKASRRLRAYEQDLRDLLRP